MKISIGADHGGVDLKAALVLALQEDGHEVIDRGTNGHESVDYPDFAHTVAHDVASGGAERGVLICTTGIGISIAANKVPGVRAAVVHNEDAASFCRRHNNANIICFGQKYQTAYLATRFMRTFLAAEFEADHPRHVRRVSKLEDMDAVSC